MASKKFAKTNGAPPAEGVDLALGDKLTTEKLERYLWSAADILRGSIDSSDYEMRNLPTPPSQPCNIFQS